jgi:dTDP-4-dehydrorhamnose reductase
VTGAGGLIGNALVESRAPEARHFSIRPLTRQILHLTDFAAVEKRFRRESPSLIIHCAAMSKSPDCQAHPAQARKVNIEVTAHLAALAERGQFIFFSTDLVFDGRKGDYVETDALNPLSVYGETKAAAETIVLQNPRHTVIRTSLNSGRTNAGNAYNEQLQSAWKNGQTLSLFTDEYRCPIPASVTGRAVWELAAQSRAGLFHLAGSHRLSRYEIGQIAAERHPELSPKVRAASLREYQGAERPADTSLNCAKIQTLLSFALPGLGEFLRAQPDEPF